MNAAAHVAAFKALLTAGPNGMTVYDAESPEFASGGYVTLYTDLGTREAVDLADANPLQVWTVQTTCNGLTPAQAIAQFDLVEARLKNVRPVVAGRQCTRIKKHLSRPIERDDDVSPARFYAVAQWRWYSTPSS